MNTPGSAAPPAHFCLDIHFSFTMTIETPCSQKSSQRGLCECGLESGCLPPRQSCVPLPPAAADEEIGIFFNPFHTQGFILRSLFNLYVCVMAVISCKFRLTQEEKKKQQVPSSLKLSFRIQKILEKGLASVLCLDPVLRPPFLSLSPVAFAFLFNYFGTALVISKVTKTAHSISMYSSRSSS